MTAYYNENDPRIAAWLRELIKAGLIAPGDVDERSIKDVRGTDLAGYTQCHFFAGIGGWSLALRLAGWPDDRPVWTASLPCQPFSAAGKRKGTADERHLWPHMHRLIAKCRPSIVFGEQVEGAVRHGWLDGVFADMEAEGYACGAVVLGAHSVNAPHIRRRLFWVADAERQRAGAGITGVEGQAKERRDRPSINSATGGLANSERGGCGANGTVGWCRADGVRHGIGIRPEITNPSLVGGLGDGQNQRRSESGGRGIARRCGDSALVHPIEPGLEGHAGHGGGRSEPGRDGAQAVGSTAAASGAGFWDDYIHIPCADGKARRLKPGIEPLAHGISGRVAVVRTRQQAGIEVQETHWYSRRAALQGFGNAIVPQVAAEFIEACREVIEHDTLCGDAQ